MRLLDLFCGRWGWSRAFATRGWHCVGIDWILPPATPEGSEFWCRDILGLAVENGWFHCNSQPPFYVACDDFDFIVASPPCEEFSVHGMKHFHPNPKYPEMGIKLFNHTRQLCEASGVPYVMENVRAAQQFVGNAVHHSGPFYLWGNAVPPLMPQGIKKAVHALQMAGGSLSGPAFNRLTPEEKHAYRNKSPWQNANSKSPQRQQFTAQVSTIPPELANCVCDYAERLLEQKAVSA